ncbi:MAG: DUF2510 domain-containing protein [Aquihabitans sp.]
MSSVQSPGAVIDIKASYFVLAFLFAFFKPKASINNSAPFDIRWGVTPIPVAPGRYQVEVWVPYLFLPTMGRNGTVIDVPAGGQVMVHWRAPWLVFLQGAVSVLGPVAIGANSAPSPQLGQSLAALPAPPVASSTPADWYPDPSGRHQIRYFDGNAWTEHVTTNGVQSTDQMNR